MFAFDAMLNVVIMVPEVRIEIRNGNWLTR